METETNLPPVADVPVPDRISHDDHWWFAGRTRAIESLLGQSLPRTEGLEILDVGCGAGNMIHHLSRYGRVRGLEVDPRPVREARLRGYHVELQDATQPYPFDEATFDLVTAFDVIEHVDDDRAILQEACRALKPGGHIAITVPALMWLWSHNDDINAHKRRYRAGDLKSKLAEAGFAVDRVTYNNFFIFPLAAALIKFRRGNEPELASHHLQEEAYEVEMEPASPPVNAILTQAGKLEAAFMRWGSFPIGTGLVAVARKPGRSA
jgi:SAM-dependent methyltransferase